MTEIQEQAPPMFSVIIPCYNQLEYTMGAVNSLMTHTDDFELILVDDASTDETPEYLAGLQRRAPAEFPNCRRIDVIRNETSLGFTLSCSTAAKQATGSHLIFFNNDAVATPFWAARMAACLAEMNEQLPIGEFALCGPATNFAAGLQMIQDIPRPFDMNILDAYAEQWYQNNQQNWRYCGFLSGFCLMITRKCWDDLGGFDDQFSPGGFEDNDICLRAWRAGYRSVIAGDTFVWHHGSRTMRRPDRNYMKGGLHNRGKYYIKYWNESGEERVPVVAGYRVKNGAKWLRMSLKKTLQVVDHVCILDDGSTDSTPRIINSLKKKHPGMITNVRYNRPFQELRDRNELWDMMHAVGKELRPDLPGWGIILDADEVFEDKVTADYLQMLARPVHPDVHGYVFKVDTFWRGREKIRIDGTFGNLKGVRMVRFGAEQRLWTPHPQGLHCGNTPMVPPDWLALTNVHLKHYGYESYDLAKKKFEFYHVTDSVKDPVNVGGDGSYRHLIDETQLSMVDWHEENTLGLGMMGRNEAEFLPQFFERNFWWTVFDQMVFVDCGSEDDTKNLALAYGCQVYDMPKSIIFQEGPHEGKLKHFGQARNFVKSKLGTRWILMMDADEWIERADHLELLRLLEHDIVAYRINVANHQPNGSISHSESFRLYRNIEDVYWTQHVHESLETALQRMGPAGLTGIAPFIVHHLGYMRGPDYVQGKLEHYADLNRLDVRADPADARPYFNLALHELNEGNNEEGAELLSKACDLNPNFMQAYKELGMVYFRRSLPLFEHALNVVSPEHPAAPGLKEIVDFARKAAIEPLKVGNPNKPSPEDAEETQETEEAAADVVPEGEDEKTGIDALREAPVDPVAEQLGEALTAADEIIAEHTEEVVKEIGEQEDRAITGEQDVIHSGDDDTGEDGPSGPRKSDTDDEAAG